ncbi:hypothetical protein V7266_21530 [Neobacillus drentensis]|uniref:hypothetical protein n=1 Tax=Neobacillus drentensis TaxID=220684 RepID=UPI002FFEA9C8
MFSRIALLVSSLFFLFGTNSFAYTHSEVSTPKFDSVQTESFDNHSALTVVTVSNTNPNISATDTEDSNKETESAVSLMKKQSVKPSVKDYVVPIAVCLFLIIGLSSYWFVFRKKYV